MHCLNISVQRNEANSNIRRWSNESNRIYDNRWNDIDNNVTEQMLLDKKITFAAGNEVKCGKSILGYVKVNSTVRRLPMWAK